LGKCSPTNQSWIRGNAKRVVKVDIYPDDHGVVVRTHRNRNYSINENTLSTKRPSLTVLVLIVLGLILIELQLVLFMRDESGSNVRVGLVSYPIKSMECTFSYEKASCSQGCCLRTYYRQDAPVAICELCDAPKSKEPPSFGRGINPALIEALFPITGSTRPAVPVTKKLRGSPQDTEQPLIELAPTLLALDESSL